MSLEEERQCKEELQVREKSFEIDQADFSLTFDSFFLSTNLKTNF